MMDCSATSFILEDGNSGTGHPEMSLSQDDIWQSHLKRNFQRVSNENSTDGTRRGSANLE